MTKFIKISADSPLARKITDHTNNQNGITYRDLQSNNPIQARLQAEVESRFANQFYYRIKRGEHPEWPAEKVIENELAARILLAFDGKEPWSCHQTYRLFDDLHGTIFGRPEVNGDRVVMLYEIHQVCKEKLELMENTLFAHYGLTRFLLLFLVREALSTDADSGSFLINKPSAFVEQINGRARLRYSIGKLTQTLVRLLDAEISRRNQQLEPFDFKRDLKGPKAIRDLRGTIISHYQVVLDSGLAPTFSMLWKESATAKI